VAPSCLRQVCRLVPVTWRAVGAFCAISVTIFNTQLHDFSPSTDGVALAIPPNGGTPILSGAIGGVEWRAIEDLRSTLNPDRSGTFSGMDEVSGVEVTGTLAGE
jgi:hypothetical protein